MSAARRRILFFAEGVTLAHVGRPIALARSLASDAFDVVMACDPRHKRFFEREPWPTLPIATISSDRFLQALASGSPVYDESTLRAYVDEDLRLIAAVRPDLIVGDFRLSLSVSARLSKVPYATVTNAYWSPYGASPEFPLPVLPISRLLPLPLARTLFRWARPAAFALHCRPLNRVRRAHGLSTLGNDLRRVYTDADFTLYADTPDLFPTVSLPDSHRYLGPILWSPPQAEPAWWNELPNHRPIVYVTLGSSGHADSLRATVQALAELPLTLIVATAGAALDTSRAQNVYAADYLPGTQAAARAVLVVCNGGSPTCQQALAAGVPVLGVARNMDQFLNMSAVVRAGAGAVLRADRLNRRRLQETVMRLLADGNFARRAAGLLSGRAAASAPDRFRDFVQALWHNPAPQPVQETP